MKENKYDDPQFYGQYSAMDRSVRGLEGAGEWHMLRGMLPPFPGKRVLNLGCGFGWHCRYAIEQGAASVTGVDIYEKMIARAREINALAGIEYLVMSIEDIDFPAGSFDVVISSLTFHYLESFAQITEKVYNTLSPGGYFVFSVEHPVFTARGDQQWVYGPDGEKLYWPVDNYFHEGLREAVFLDEKIIKYHKTLTTYISDLLKTGFRIKDLAEAMPDKGALESIPEMKDELRRPMMMLISAEKEQ